jgi:hypothetical protein
MRICPLISATASFSCCGRRGRPPRLCSKNSLEHECTCHDIVYESMYYSSRGLGDFRHILGQLTQKGANSRRERRNFYTYLLRRELPIAFRTKWHSRDEYTQHQPAWLPIFQ